jgi:hypothetical protein
MQRSTDQWAQKLIAADVLLHEQYLEMVHLDPPLIVAIYIRAVALHYRMNKLQRRLASRLRQAQIFRTVRL